MILYGIVGPPWQKFSYFRPLIADAPVGIDNYSILGLGPRRLFDSWIEMIVPSLSALFADTSFEVPRYEGPLFWTITFHQFDDFLVFL